MRKTLLTLFVIFLLSGSQVFGQITLQGGVGLGMMSPQGDYAGTTEDYYAGTKYGLSSGFNLHGKLRVGLLSFKVFGEVDYSMLSNSGNSQPGQGEVEVSHNILSLKIGPEFSLPIPMLPVTPYGQINIQFNTFTGETKFQGVSNVPSNTFELESASRIGFGAGIGALIDISPLMQLDVQVEYNLMNPGGREYLDTDPSANKRYEVYEALNDGIDPLAVIPSTEHFVQEERSISSLLFKVTLMVGI